MLWVLLNIKQAFILPPLLEENKGSYSFMKYIKSKIRFVFTIVL